MFSNLRVEGGSSNHLLPVRYLLIYRDVDDLVEVVRFDGSLATTDARSRAEKVFMLKRQFRWLSEPKPVTVPRMELMRAVARYEGEGASVELRYIEDGRTIDLRSASDASNRRPRLSWVDTWLRAYRAVEPSTDYPRCRW